MSGLTYGSLCSGYGGLAAHDHPTLFDLEQ